MFRSKTAKIIDTSCVNSKQVRTDAFQLQLETKITKMEAEEKVYAVAELEDQHAQLPSYARTQDIATSPLPGQPRLPVLLNGATHSSFPTPSVLDPSPETLEALHGLPNKFQGANGSEEVHWTAPVVTQPGSKFNIFSPQADSWFPQIR